MDVDSGESYAFRGFKRLLTSSLEVPVRAPTVCLPYSLVPGIDINSPLFFKAVDTISKQQKPGASTATASTGTEKKTAPGMSFFHIVSFVF
jgi:hypothetical protein